MKPEKLFGTDGIRGTFGQWPLTEEIVRALSVAVAQWLRKKYSKRPAVSVVIGKDTRASCDTIEQWLAQGLRAQGITVYSAGVIPTPGLAFLTNTQDVELGFMISASHNPAADNGIKLFKHNGFKLTEPEERRLERLIATVRAAAGTDRVPVKTGSLEPMSAQTYLQHLAACVQGICLNGLPVVVDCAHGATSAYAAAVLRAMGCRVQLISCRPNGKNINKGCGSLHPEIMAQRVAEKGAAIGFAFDGDGDRVIACDEQGRILDGDYMMLAVARYWQHTGRLKTPVIVGTSMSNFGLQKALEALGITLVRADVGDKYVLQEMLNHQAQFGGEQSGHIIFLDYATTGDGLLTAVQLLRMIAETGKPVSRLMQGLKKYPQLLKNLRVKEKKDLQRLPRVQQAITHAEQRLAGNGRVVTRYSGTEPLARVMIEGPNKRLITGLVDSVLAAIKEELGE